MTKSELIESIARNQSHLSEKDVELVVKGILSHITTALASGDRVEVRGFGSFSLNYRAARKGRNPKTGESLQLQESHVIHFKPGKQLKERINATFMNG